MSEVLVSIPKAGDAVAFTDKEQFDKLLRKITDIVEAHKPDVSTVTGRKAIASLAYKVAKTKTALDAQGKALTDEWRAKTDLVNSSRRRIRDELDALKDRARQPLTEWEQAEEKRTGDHQAALHRLESLTVLEDESVEAIEERISAVGPIMQRDWEEYDSQAEKLAEQVRDTLKEKLAAAQTLAAERAELERLRAEAAERDRQEAERREAEEAKRREEERLAAEARAKEEQAQREAEAAERARKEAEERAQREIEAERQRAEAEIRAAKEEAERKERQRAEEEARIKAEEARRAADIEHRRCVNGAARDAIMETTGLSKGKAEQLVAAIASGGVPAVSIQY